MRLSFKKIGFTLIELLVVIAILGILVSLLAVGARRARSKGHIAGCASNLRQIGVALTLYADDHDEKYPHSEDNLIPLYPAYIDDLNIFTCPATGNKLTDPSRIITVQPGVEGMDYEYRGTYRPDFPDRPGGPGATPPSLISAERKPTKYLLAWDNDDRGTNRIIDEYDNHGTLGGNKLFSDGSVRWFTAAEWGFGE